MTDKTTDSTQPESTADTEGLTIVRPGDRDHIRTEEVDRDDPPVADLARELTPEQKDANRLEGDWSGDGDVNHADDAQDVTDGFNEKT
ncbi:MAG: hypothetical protein AAGL89_10445 [Pseudomonadota bacterium]